MNKKKFYDEAYENKKVLKGPFCFIRWIIKMELIIIFAIFSFLLIFNLIPNKTKFFIKFNLDKMRVSNILAGERFSSRELEDYLNRNNNINDEEREFIKHVLEEEIRENYQYIDINKTLNRLSKYKVTYKESKKIINSYDNENANIAGSYNYIFNNINLYKGKNIYHINDEFNFNTVDEEIYLHEINHLASNSKFNALYMVPNNANYNNFNMLNDSIFSFNALYNNVISEIINELFTREYYELYIKDEDINYNKGYEDYMTYAYLLVELLPEDDIKRFKFSNNESYVISSLLEIDNNLEEAYNLITSIKTIGLYNEKQLEDENYKRIHDSYSYFYEKKNSKPMIEDINILLYIYNTPICEESERIKVEKLLNLKEDDMVLDIIPKSYISEKMKEENSKVKVQVVRGHKSIEEISF